MDDDTLNIFYTASDIAEYIRQPLPESIMEVLRSKTTELERCQQRLLAAHRCGELSDHDFVRQYNALTRRLDSLLGIIRQV